MVTEHLQHTGCHWSVIRLLVIGISEVYHQIQNSWSTIKLYLAILFFPALSTVWGRQDCNGPFYKSPDNCCIASWSNGQGFKATDIAFILLSQKYKVFWGKVIFVQMFIVGVWKVQLQLHGSGNGAVRWQRRAVSHTRPHASTTDTHTHAL